MTDTTTIAGAAAGVTLVVAVCKRVFGLRGRHTQWVALAFGLLIAFTTGLHEGIGDAQGWVDVVLHGFVITAMAIGIHQGVAQK